MKQLNYLTTTLFFLLLLSFSNRAISQTSKQHFIIQNAGSPEETIKYTNALKDFDFEQYRFYSKRRIIKFSNTNAVIELLSAKELLDLYQRPIHPFNIMNNTPSKEIEFYYFSDSGKVKINEISKH
jgi:hypothetical protein